MPPFDPDEYEEELKGIIARAAEKGVIDLDRAVEDFKNHTLRGKAELGAEDWQVSTSLPSMLSSRL